MPFVKIEMFGGRTVDQKRTLVASVTEAVCTSIDCPPAAVWVSIEEKSKDNWGAAGQLLSDQR